MKKEYEQKRINSIVIRFIICILNALAIAALIISQIVRGTQITYALVLFLPLLLYISSKDLYFIISTDMSKVKESEYGYYRFMKEQGAKFYPNKENAKKLYIQYSVKSQDNYEKIKESLAEELRSGNPDKLSISVLCGSLFTYGVKSDSETLFRAKYSYGNAGDMIYDEWINTLCDEGENRQERIDKSVSEFKDYWERF